MRIGSSCQKVSNSASACAMRCAAGRRHSEWNSTMMSMRLPTAARILRNGSSAFCRSGPEMYWPVARFGERIERPDLHAGDALLEQRLRELVGAVQEGVEVLVRALRFSVEAPVLRCSARRRRAT